MAELFRKEAVDNLSSPERLDSRLRVVTPKFWMPLLAVGLLLMAALVWSFLGRISVHIEGRGLLMRSQHVQELRTPATLVVKRVLVQPGMFVRKDQPIAEVELPQESGRAEAQTLKAPIEGMLLDSVLKEGRRLKQDDLYGAIGTYSADNQTQTCIVFLKLNEGQLAAMDLRAFVVPEVARSADRGAIEARVVYVRPIPVSIENLQEMFDDKILAEMLVGTDRLSKVIVELPSATRRTPDGKIVPVASGTLSSVRIEIERKPAAAFLFPGLNTAGSENASGKKVAINSGGRVDNGR